MAQDNADFSGTGACAVGAAVLNAVDDDGVEPAAVPPVVPVGAA